MSDGPKPIIKANSFGLTSIEVKKPEVSDEPKPIKTNSFGLPSIEKPEVSDEPRPLVLGVGTQKPIADVKGVLGAGKDKAVSEFIKKNFNGLTREDIERIERQVSQVYPFNIGVVMDWGGPALKRHADLVGIVSSVGRDLTNLNALDTIDSAIRDLVGTKRLFSFRHRKSAADHKMAIVAIRLNVENYAGKVDGLSGEAGALAARLTTFGVSLGVAVDVYGSPSEPGLASAISGRRSILNQAATQARIIVKQIDELNRQIVDIMSKADHLINVTIPAIEAAK